VTPATNSQVRKTGAFGVLKLTLHADSDDWQFIPIPGQTFTESGTATVHGAPSAPIATDRDVLVVGRARIR